MLSSYKHGVVVMGIIVEPPFLKVAIDGRLFQDMQAVGINSCQRTHIEETLLPVSEDISTDARV